MHVTHMRVTGSSMSARGAPQLHHLHVLAAQSIVRFCCLVRPQKQLTQRQQAQLTESVLPQALQQHACLHVLTVDPHSSCRCDGCCVQGLPEEHVLRHLSGRSRHPAAGGKDSTALRPRLDIAGLLLASRWQFGTIRPMMICRNTATMARQLLSANGFCTAKPMACLLHVIDPGTVRPWGGHRAP